METVGGLMSRSALDLGKSSWFSEFFGVRGLRVSLGLQNPSSWP